MRVVILVPRRAGYFDRDAIWKFTKKRWQQMHPTWEIYEGHHNDGPFNRAQAINEAAEAAGSWDVALIIDSDILIDPHQVRSSVDVAHCTGGFVVTSAERWMLSAEGTTTIMNGYNGSWIPFVRQKYGNLEDPHGAQVSSCVAVPRSLWAGLGGFDECHVGYGWEDVSFRSACETMTGKATVFLGPHPNWHFHHRPSTEDRRDSELKLANQARAMKYISALGDKAATRLLLEEALQAKEVNRDSGDLPSYSSVRYLQSR